MCHSERSEESGEGPGDAAADTPEDSLKGCHWLCRPRALKCAAPSGYAADFSPRCYAPTPLDAAYAASYLP